MVKPLLVFLSAILVLLNIPLLSTFVQYNYVTFYIVIAVNILLASSCLVSLKRAHLAEIKVDINRVIPLLIQGSVQLSIFYYVIFMCPGKGVSWFWSLRMPFIFYQVIFAFTFDYLLTIARGKKYRPQLYVIPFVLSINLFVAFINSLAAMHLLIIVIGILIKTYVVRKDINGRLKHIFNPSFIVLTIISLSLLFLSPEFQPHHLHSTDIQTHDFAFVYDVTPGFNYFLFFVGCITLWLPNSYLASFGAYSCVMFLDYLSFTFFGYRLFFGLAGGSVLIAIMLGISDPQTSPQTSHGKFAYGVAYGLCLTFFNFFFHLVNQTGIYYSKILAIPLLNIMSRKFDASFNFTVFKLYDDLGFIRARLTILLLFVAVFMMTSQNLALNYDHSMAQLITYKINTALGFESTMYKHEINSSPVLQD